VREEHHDGVLGMTSFEERHHLEGRHEERQHGVLHKTLTLIRVTPLKEYEERQPPEEIETQAVTYPPTSDGPAMALMNHLGRTSLRCLHFNEIQETDAE
jgi:hypothetical protein